jgi:pimeloyl-ACP methyl ester carboxylesterase
MSKEGIESGRGGKQSLKLAYSDSRGRGTPILFVHGFFHNRSVWEKLASALPAQYRPISVDLRGHGESPWSLEGDYDLRSYARDLSALLDDLDIRRAFVVGHSMGGNVATLFAKEMAARALGLVLVDTGPTLEATGTDHVVDEVEDALRSYPSVSAWRDQLSLIHRSGDPEILDRLASTSGVARLDGRFEPALDPGVLGRADDPVDLVTLEHDLWSALRGLKCPVLVVRGGVSAILREKVAREMVEEALQFGRLVTLEKAGHAVMIDDGPGLREAIQSFLADVIG